MQRYKILTGLLLWIPLMVFSQSEVAADRLFQAGNYAEAQTVYEALLRAHPKKPLYAYRYARCAQEQGDYDTALRYFERAGDKYPLRYFYTGEIHLQQWHTEQAIDAYTTYLQALKEPNEREPYVRTQIRYAEKLQRYLRHVEKVKILDSIEVRTDSLLTAFSLLPENGTLTPDSIGFIYTNQRSDRRFRSVAVGACRRLVSSQRLLDYWTVPDTLPKTVHIAPKQIAPYILSDGVTLYFAANDSNGLGGYDLYVSRYNTATGTYTPPANLGFPFNSTANEYFYVLDEVRNIGYFATDRFSQDGYARVYSFVPTEPKSYWSHLPQDTLVAYAQLRCILKADAPEDTPTPPTPAESSVTSRAAILFVLNDSTFYRSMDEFCAPAAKAFYTQWEAHTQQLTADRQRLEQLRAQYATADKQQREALSPRILHLEDECRQTQQQCEALLQQARYAEADCRKAK